MKPLQELQFIFQMHTMSQVFFHSITRESKNVSKGRRTQELLQKHAIFISHKLSPYTHSQDLTRKECQVKEEAPHLGASLQLLGFIYPNLNGKIL